MPKKESDAPAVVDPWVGPKYIAQKYNLSRETGRRWIIKLTQKYLNYTDGRFKRGRHSRLRRIPLSLLEEHIDELLN